MNSTGTNVLITFYNAGPENLPKLNLPVLTFKMKVETLSWIQQNTNNLNKSRRANVMNTVLKNSFSYPDLAVQRPAGPESFDREGQANFQLSTWKERQQPSTQPTIDQEVVESFSNVTCVAYVRNRYCPNQFN